MIFEEKQFYCYIILTDQISLSGCRYIMQYWPICVLWLFVPSCDVINFDINLIFLIKPFLLHESTQKIKYLYKSFLNVYIFLKVVMVNLTIKTSEFRKHPIIKRSSSSEFFRKSLVWSFGKIYAKTFTAETFLVKLQVI